MTSAFRRSLLTLVLTAVPGTSGAQLVNGDAVDQFVRAEMERQHITGLSLAIVKGGRVVHARGFGWADREQQIAVTPETVFKIGSVSKQFLASGIMLLVQDGRVRLDDPVSKYIGDTPESWSAVTLRHLLSHTSGILREGPAFDPMVRKPDIDVIRSAYSAPLRFETGTSFQYCNVCYFALAEIIARVSGQPWDAFMRERVFAPVRMEATGTTIDPIPNRARGYDWRDDAHHATPEWQALRPSGAFVSTVLDLARWDSVLYAGAILKRESRDTMWTNTQVKGGRPAPYGLGWYLENVQCPRVQSSGVGCRALAGRRLVHHGGSLPGFRALVTHIPQDSLTVIVLTNTDDA
ncbi:MAG TPA: serine hydrolase domain-containing protein, partial [Longimicrobiales bacterium]|nr:serine hydrolase domain-containing protein [Longimicrobiales bacterium]